MIKCPATSCDIPVESPLSALDSHGDFPWSDSLFTMGLRARRELPLHIVHILLLIGTRLQMRLHDEEVVDTALRSTAATS